MQTGSTTDAADLVAGVLDLARALAEGTDANGDGQITPAPGEGGVRAMCAEAQLLGAIEILAAIEQVATPTSEPTPTPELISEHAEEPVDEHAE